MKVSEPAIACTPSSIQGLRNRLQISINETEDMEKLQQCLELLHSDSMPGIYTEAEFDEVVKRSEKGGNATQEELNAFFHRWGI